MFNVNQVLFLKHSGGLKQHGWCGALVAKVVGSDTYPELKSQLEKRLEQYPEAIKEFVAVEWAKNGSLTAVDGFYHSSRFKPIECLVEQGNGDSNKNVRPQS